MFSGLLDSGAVIIEFNDRTGITGYTAEDIVGKNWFEVFIPDAEIVTILEVFTGLFHGDNPSWHYENELVCKDGSRKMIKFNNNLIKDQQGRAEFLFFTATED